MRDPVPDCLAALWGICMGGSLLCLAGGVVCLFLDLDVGYWPIIAALAFIAPVQLSMFVGVFLAPLAEAWLNRTGR